MYENPSQPPVEAERPVLKSTLDWPLLTWTDPVKTGKVFASLVFSLILVKYVNLLSLFFRLATYALFASGLAELSGKIVTGRGFVARFKPEKLCDQCSTKILKYLDIIARELPEFEAEVQRTFYAEDIEKTLKVGGACYILYNITSFFNLYRLIFGSIILAFSLPYVYDRYHGEASKLIQKLLKEGTVKCKEQMKLIHEKSKPYLEQAQDKLGPVSQFIQSKYQTRTASTTVDQSEEPKTSIPSFAATSGAQLQQCDDVVIEPIDSTHEFPSVPETSPLAPETTPLVPEVDAVTQSATREQEELLNNIANAN